MQVENLNKMGASIKISFLGVFGPIGLIFETKVDGALKF